MILNQNTSIEQQQNNVPLTRSGISRPLTAPKRP
jgi:hypothetical protein